MLNNIIINTAYSLSKNIHNLAKVSFLSNLGWFVTDVNSLLLHVSCVSLWPFTLLQIWNFLILFGTCSNSAAITVSMPMALRPYWTLQFKSCIVCRVCKYSLTTVKCTFAVANFPFAVAKIGLWGSFALAKSTLLTWQNCLSFCKRAGLN